MGGTNDDAATAVCLGMRVSGPTHGAISQAKKGLAKWASTASRELIEPDNSRSLGTRAKILDDLISSHFCGCTQVSYCTSGLAKCRYGEDVRRQTKKNSQKYLASQRHSVRQPCKSTFCTKVNR